MSLEGHRLLPGLHISKSWSPDSETRILAAVSPEPTDLYAAAQKLGDGALCAEREEAL